MSGGLYVLMLMLVYAGATIDYFRLQFFRGRRVGQRRSLLQGYSLRIINRWVLCHVAALLVFWLLGDRQRGISVSLIFLTASMMMLLIVPAGQHLAMRARMPSFAMFRRTEARGRNILEFLALFAIATLGALALMHFARWRTDPQLTKTLDMTKHSPAANAFYIGYVLIGAAVTEEILFRHYLLPRVFLPLQRWFPGKALFFAVVLVSLLFALGHAGMLVPAWLKFVQIFVLGLALGTARVRLGTDYAILMHVLFNTVMAAYAIGLQK